MQQLVIQTELLLHKYLQVETNESAKYGIKCMSRLRIYTDFMPSLTKRNNLSLSIGFVK